MSAAAHAVAPARLVHTSLFGVLEVPEAQLLHFADGLCGFRECRQWVLIDGRKRGTSWLQSADQSELAFLLVDPFVIHEGYGVDLAPSDLTRLAADQATELVVLVIVTLPRTSDEPATANLQGPVVINARLRTGAQIVLGEGAGSVRHVFSLAFLV